jgi:hypothetical protein
MFQALQITIRVLQVGLGHLGEVQSHHGVEFNRVYFVFFAHHLLVYLATRRYVDFYIGQDFRLATEPVTGQELAGFQRLNLGFSQLTQVNLSRYHSFPGKRTLHGFYLAAATTGAATAY